MSDPQPLLSDLVFGESPRWGPDNRLWLADWGLQDLLAVGLDGQSERIMHLPASGFRPFSFDWTSDGQLLVVAFSENRVLRRERDGALATHADLNGLERPYWNEIVIDGCDNAYVNNIGFDLVRGAEPEEGSIVLVTPTGDARRVADGLAFPNGMVVSPDNRTLICAESYAGKLTAFDIAPDGSLSNRRVWADLGSGAPDGICLDSDGAIWYGDVPNRCCVRVAEGGEVLERIQLEVGCFACMLGGPDGRTLFMVVRRWDGVSTMSNPDSTGQVLAGDAPAASAGWPSRR